MASKKVKRCKKDLSFANKYKAMWQDDIKLRAFEPLSTFENRKVHFGLKLRAKNERKNF